MRKSESEDKRRREEALAEYRSGIVAARLAAANKPAEEVDKTIRSRAVAMFPKLSPQAAYEKYVRDILNRPPAPPRQEQDPIIFRMGLIQQMRDTNTPRPPTQQELNALKIYEEQQKRDPLAQAIANALEAMAAKRKSN